EMMRENTNAPECVGEIDEAFLLRHSGTFAGESRRRARNENPVLKIYVREFKQFLEEIQPELLVVVHAIEETATLDDAEKSIGMARHEFRRCRWNLSQLKKRFLEERKTLPRTSKVSFSLEMPVQPTTKVFLREELYERVWTTPMYRLAKEFGYSDVGFAKLCEK